MRLKICVLLILTIFSTFSFVVLYEVNNRDKLEVVFLDVGQGDSILIKTPYRTEILIDAGKNSIVKRSLGEHLPFYDHKIDLTISTHLDEDHIGGFKDFLNGYTSDYHVLFSTSTKENIITNSLWNDLKEKTVITKKVKRGDRIILGDDIYIDILHPKSDENLKNENDKSLVLKLVYLETSFLLTGDISSEVEKELVQIYGEYLDSDVLKVAHHGSSHSSSKDFLDVVKPMYAVISAGKDNRYGHPHDVVIERLKEVQSDVSITLKDKSIRYVSDGKTIKKI